MAEDALNDRSTDSTARSQRVVFIHIPKTAGTSVARILRSNAPAHARLGNVFKGGGGYVKAPEYERMVTEMKAIAGGCLFWGHTPFALAS